MKTPYEARFFLGANSAGGFFSLYDGFTDATTDTLNVIKGGPGCGKSTFMRTIAARVHDAGYSAEYIHCSGDPDSLDGVYFPELHTGYVDGTAPHVIEPVYAGASGGYVNVGEFYDAEALRRSRESIIRLTNAYKAYYQRAYRLLGASAAAADALAEPVPEEALVTAARRAKGIISRELRSEGRGGVTKRRFLSAASCRGELCFYSTAEELADRLYVLDNDLGIGTFVVELIASAAEERKLDIIRCQSPLRPERTEHLIIPGLGLAFITQTSRLPFKGEAARRLRLDSIPKRQGLALSGATGRAAARLPDALLDEAMAALAKAKSLHDRLEEVYNPHVDFEAVTALAESHADRLLAV